MMLVFDPPKKLADENATGAYRRSTTSISSNPSDKVPRGLSIRYQLYPRPKECIEEVAGQPVAPARLVVGALAVLDQIQGLQACQEHLRILTLSGGKPVETPQRFLTVVVTQCEPCQLKIGVVVSGLDSYDPEVDFAGFAFIAGDPEMGGIVVQHINGARRFGHRTAVKVIRLGCPLQIVESGAEQAQRLGVTRVRRNFGAKLPLGRLEIAARKIAERIAQLRRLSPGMSREGAE
jgi:hypothetical protein